MQDFRTEVSVPLRQGTETAVRKYCTKPQNHTKVTSVQNIHIHCILSTPVLRISPTRFLSTESLVLATGLTEGDRFQGAV